MQISFWQNWLELQIKHNLDYIAEKSIKNFHFSGLNYICFDFETNKKAIRLYIVEPKDTLDTTKVNIHNHLYDSQLLCLEGTITNTTYKVNNDRDEFYCYHLTSALHPSNEDRKIKLRFLSRKGLDISTQKCLFPGDFHFQPHTEIHNVQNDIKNFTSFMVFEFATVKEHSTLFSKTDLGSTIPTPNAYLKYEKKEIRELVGNLIERLNNIKE